MKRIEKEALRESLKPRSLFEHTWFAGLVLFLVSVVIMTIDNI